MAAPGGPVTPADYDAWYDSARGRWIGDTEYRLLHALLAPRPGARLLDVGCGTGWFTRQFVRLPGVEVVGVDNNAEWLAYARTRDGDASYLPADARALPFATASFDYVVSVTALGFIPDWHQALAEMVRVARKRIVVGVLNRHSLLWRAKGRDGGSGAYRGACWQTPHELRQALVACSLRQVGIRSAVFLPDGSGMARLIERCLPNVLPCGGFLAAFGNK